MTNAPVYGCEGCRGTAGKMGCPEHGGIKNDYIPSGMTVDYQEFYKKIDGEVYKFYRFGKGEWLSQKTPHKEVPYYEWGETK